MPPRGEVEIVVFARAPEAGRAKTRLIPAVGPDGAAALHRAFVEDVCALVAPLSPRRTLALSGDGGALVHLAALHGMTVVDQGEGDLGARMERAIGRALSGGARGALVLGTDSPMIEPERIAGAIALLDEHDVVVGPAEDGGYWTIAARTRAPELFVEMPWGTAGVFAETERRLRAGPWRFAVAERAWDVDEPADLARLDELLRVRPGGCAATRAALEVWYRPRRMERGAKS